MDKKRLQLLLLDLKKCLTLTNSEKQIDTMAADSVVAFAIQQLLNLDKMHLEAEVEMLEAILAD